MKDDNRTIIIGMLDNPGSLEIARRVYYGGISPCLNAHASDTVPKVVVENMKNNLAPIVLGRVLPMISNKIHQDQEVYDKNGIMCTVKATHYKDPPKVLIYE